MYFENLSPESKVWIYKADRELTSQEVQMIESSLAEFIPQWAAHGNKLFGGARVLHDWFVVIAVDEKQQMASGCSIDTSVRFMQDLGRKLNIDFFNRLKVLIEKDGERQQVAFSELGEYADWSVYNPMITNLNDLNHNWLKVISESQFA